MPSPILNRDFQHPSDSWYHIEPKGNHPNSAAGVVQVVGSDFFTMGRNNTVDRRPGVIHAPEGDHTFWMHPWLTLVTPHDWTLLEHFPLQFLVDWTETWDDDIPENWGSLGDWYLQQFALDHWDAGDVFHGGGQCTPPPLPTSTPPPSPK